MNITQYAANVLGQRAFADGESVSANPFDMDENEALYDAWLDGWLDASEVEIVAG